MNINLVLEITAVVFSLTFLFLLMKENIWCWLFGIVSSLLSIYLFFSAKLYSEAFLYFFYVLIGIYGWYKWSNQTNENPLSVSVLAIKKHINWILIGFIFAFLLGYTFQHFTDAAKSYIDAHTTIFSFIASYLEANKYLYAWGYWIVVNGASIWLYYTQGLTIYAGLMVIYFIMSWVGFWNWRKSYLGIGN